MWPDHDDHSRINSDGIEPKLKSRSRSIKKSVSRRPNQTAELMIVSRGEKLYRVVGAMK